VITKEMAMSLPIGTTLYHKTLRNADGSTMRARINGKCKTWKRRPDDYHLPMKYGYKGRGFYVGIPCHTQFGAESVTNPSNWSTVDPTEEARKKEFQESRKKRLRKKLNLADDTPDGILHDAMIDAGVDEKLAEICTR
jgi:hypothetical protein